MNDRLNAQSATESLAEEAATWFVRMREPQVSAHERQHFQRWLEASSLHQREYANFQKLWGDLDGLPSPRRKNKRRAVVATTVAVFAALFLVHGQFAVDAENATKIGEVRQLVLADNSVLELDADTLLRVEYSLWKRRIVLERGQAQFKVAPGLRPFEVVAGDGTMRDIGTTFNVREEQGKVSVSVQEGAVEISLRSTAQKYLLTGGQQADYQNGRISAAPAQPVNVDPSWRSNRWIFDNVSLGEVVREINRQHEHPLRLADASLDNYRVSGVFDRSDRSGLLKSLVAILPLRVEENRDETLLRRR